MPHTAQESPFNSPLKVNEKRPQSDIVEISDETGIRLIAQTFGDSAQKYAASITRACNSHYELLSALKAARADLQRIATNQSGISEDDLTDIARPDINVIDQITTAILRAEGK